MEEKHSESLDGAKTDICKKCRLSIKLDHLIEEIAKKEGYSAYDATKKRFIAKDANLLGDLHEITIKGTNQAGNKETNIFAKTVLLKHENVMKLFSLPQLYRTELFAYNELAKIFQELQDQAKVAIQDRFKMVNSFAESDKDVILLDNIVSKGYEPHPRLEVITLRSAEISVKELAKLHSLSFVIQRKMPEYFNTVIKSMKQPYIFGEYWNATVDNIFGVVMNFMCDELKDKVEKGYFNALSRLKEYIEDESIQYCLCHGDYKLANLMRKMDDGELVDIIPIDYQFLHYGCPVFDFFYFIFHSTDRQFRKDHLEYLKEFYYGSVKNYLQYFNIDVESVFPKDDFERIYKEKLDIGLMIALSVLPFTMVAELQELTVLTPRQKIVCETFKDRLRGIVEDFIDWGYL